MNTFLLWIWVARPIIQAGLPIHFQVFWWLCYLKFQLVPKYSYLYSDDNKIFDFTTFILKLIDSTYLCIFQSFDILLFLKDMIGELGSSPACKQSECWYKTCGEIIELFGCVIFHIGFIDWIIIDKVDLYLNMYDNLKLI